MKKFVSTTLLITALLFTCCRHNHHQSISIQDSDSEFWLKGDFEESKTSKLRSYINKCLLPNQIFAYDDEYADITTELEGNSKISIQSSPGHIYIYLHKKQNPNATYKRVKKMCMGIKDILADN